MATRRASRPFVLADSRGRFADSGKKGLCFQLITIGHLTANQFRTLPFPPIQILMGIAYTHPYRLP